MEYGLTQLVPGSHCWGREPDKKRSHRSNGASRFGIAEHGLSCATFYTDINYAIPQYVLGGVDEQPLAAGQTDPWHLGASLNSNERDYQVSKYEIN